MCIILCRLPEIGRKNDRRDRREEEVEIQGRLRKTKHSLTETPRRKDGE